MSKTATTADFVDAMSIEECEEALSLIRVRLRKFDETAREILRRNLIRCINKDLQDADKATPGLYQAALRLLGEESIDLSDAIPAAEKARLEEEAPFKPSRKR